MAVNETNGSPSGDGDPRLARLYRAAAGEQPPAHLDAAILAAARRAVGARPTGLETSFLRRWRLPVSVAAVIVLSASLVTLTVEERDERLAIPPLPQSTKSPEPATEPPAAAMRPSGRSAPVETGPAAKSAAPPPGRAAAGTSAKKESAGVAPDASPPARPQPFAAAPRAPAPLQQSEPRQPEASVRKRDAEPAGAGADSSSVPEAADERMGIRRAVPAAGASMERSAVPSGNALLIREYEHQPPEKWLEKIAALRREGNTATADALLAEFRKRYPEYPLPAALR